MTLLKGGTPIEDSWVHLDDETAAPAGAAITVSFARWQAESEALKASGVTLGVRLTGDDAAEEITDDLNALQLVVIAFPAFTDGRGYSIARILRERYGYEGEVRATGNILRDQASLMTRCGFDAFDLAAHTDVADWLEGLKDITLEYQPAADRRRSVPQIRHA